MPGSAHLVPTEVVDEDEAAKIRDRVSGTTELDDLFDCDLIVEAIIDASEYDDLVLRSDQGSDN